MKKLYMPCTFGIRLEGLYISTQFNTFHISAFVLVLKRFALPEIPFTEENWVLYCQPQLFMGIQNHKNLIMCEY